EGGYLKLDDVQVEQNGLYTCYAENVFYDDETGNAQDYLILDVQFSPDIATDLTGDIDEVNGYVIEGSNFTVECVIMNANPEVESISWSDSADNVVSTEPLVIISDVGKEQHGTYTCEARNTFWDATQGITKIDVFIDVQYSPSVTVTDETGFNVVEGNSYFAVCEVDSNPDSVITWLYPDGTETNGHQLEITNTNRNDAGTYTCTAVTTFWDGSSATDSGTMDLNVEYEGIVTLVGSEKEIDESESVNFTCTVSDSNPDPFKLELLLDGQVIEHFKDDQGITHLEYTISDSTDEDAGSYICIATQRFWNDAENDVTSNVHHLTVNV
ncbi:B-cell receptor CD22-like, partial [Saccoglossus kowalevskii]|uniref:Hemicentin-1-like n=1 Tax=Saccoglossus kowalevskii TaxID=10224 RepID=A0ABM0MTN0_SACKO